MGSLESGFPIKREPRFGRSSSIRSTEKIGVSSPVDVFGQNNRSRTARTFRGNIGYVQVACGAIVLFSFIFLLQMYFLPGFRMERGGNFDRVPDFFRKGGGGKFQDLSFLDDLDFGEDILLKPVNMFPKFHKESEEANKSIASLTGHRYGYINPKLAFVFADLWIDPHQIPMITVAKALRDVGYEIEVFSLQNGAAYDVWKHVGFSTNLITADENMKFSVDWLNYNAILVNSLKAVDALYSLMQEPFRDIPVIWTIDEQALAMRLRGYASNHQEELVNNWRKLFRRATAVVFPNYVLPVAYSACDSGNFCVIPGSSMEDWETVENNIVPEVAAGKNFVFAIVGSQLVYKGRWLEHALILQALYPVFRDLASASSHPKIIVLSGSSTRNYSSAIETIAENLNYPNGTVEHVAGDGEGEDALRVADLVIYGSFLEESTFPVILQKAMHLGKPVVAPDLPMIRKHVSDWMNGFLFPKEKISHLTDILFHLIDNGTLSVLAHSVASRGKATVKSFMVKECVEGYASLLENVLVLPSEVAVPKPGNEISEELKTEWGWHHFEAISENSSSSQGATEGILDRVEKRFSPASGEDNVTLSVTDTTFLYRIWEDQRLVDTAYMKKKREDDELKDRMDQPRGTWDEIYRNVRRPDRSLHERDDEELERTEQPLCIYEPYYGQGTWSFLHNSSLYRGVSLLSRGRRPGGDDVDAASRLPILSNAYYRDVLGEYGAFFAIANRIDRVHKSAWIGFQSWRATARKVSLSPTAERSLQEAVEGKRHGDALYFWVAMDTDPRRQPGQDFWSFCDALNAGNCQFAFSEALRKMYDVKAILESLPSMPSNGGTWSVMHCWALPTRSFLEFVMFSRMFVDALDERYSEEHRKSGWCHLSLSKDKHCYSRLLELLVNVWAYHSARRVVFVDPISGSMQEQHELSSRRGRMWIRWFQLSTLKSMDEELAEEFDTERGTRPPRLWPSTGEVVWQGVNERERSHRMKEKERRKQQSRDKIHRMKQKSRQKVLGKYVRPVDDDETNTTAPATEKSR